MKKAFKRKRPNLPHLESLYENPRLSRSNREWKWINIMLYSHRQPVPRREADRSACSACKTRGTRASPSLTPSNTHHHNSQLNTQTHSDFPKPLEQGFSTSRHWCARQIVLRGQGHVATVLSTSNIRELVILPVRTQSWETFHSQPNLNVYKSLHIIYRVILRRAQVLWGQEDRNLNSESIHHLVGWLKQVTTLIRGLRKITFLKINIKWTLN